MKTLRPARLGVATHDSPLPYAVPDDQLVPSDTLWPHGQPPHELLLFEKAGPRRRLFFEPARTRAAIVTCGGLCPGLNNVIRSVTRELRRSYGVTLGVRQCQRMFRQMGFRLRKPRPQVAQSDPVVVSAAKKTSPPGKAQRR